MRQHQDQGQMQHLGMELQEASRLGKQEVRIASLDQQQSSASPHKPPLSALQWYRSTIQRARAMPQSKIQYQAGLSLTQFTEQYGTESQCEAALEKARWPEGFRCPRCGGAHYGVIHVWR